VRLWCIPYTYSYPILTPGILLSIALMAFAMGLKSCRTFSLLQQNLQSQYFIATTAVAHLHILHGVLEAAVITLAHCVTTVWTELPNVAP